MQKQHGIKYYKPFIIITNTLTQSTKEYQRDYMFRKNDIVTIPCFHEIVVKAGSVLN